MTMRICPQPGCPKTVDECHNPAHRPGGWQPDPVRGTRTERGYDAAWQRARRAALHAQPRCTCGAIATTVDHITPLAEGGARLDPNNLRPLCDPCHTRKTSSDAAHGRRRAAAQRRGQR